MTDSLYSERPEDRIRAASAYTVFPPEVSMPPRWKRSWQLTLRGRDPQLGRPWETDLARACRQTRWPAHAFGTANASLLVLWHRPGVEPPGSSLAAWIDPPTPVLGGVGHAHVDRFVPDALRSDPSWNLLWAHRSPRGGRPRTRRPRSVRRDTRLGCVPAPGPQPDRQPRTHADPQCSGTPTSLDRAGLPKAAGSGGRATSMGPQARRAASSRDCWEPPGDPGGRQLRQPVHAPGRGARAGARPHRLRRMARSARGRAEPPAAHRGTPRIAGCFGSARPRDMAGPTCTWVRPRPMSRTSARCRC